MRQTLIRALLLGLFAVNIYSANIPHLIQQIDASRYRWIIELPMDQDRTLSPSGIEYAGWSTTINSHGFMIPVMSKIVHSRNGAPEIQIQIINPTEIQINTQLEAQIEQAKGMDLQVAASGEDPASFVRLKYIRDGDGYEVWAISVMGAILNETTQTWSIPGSISLDINTRLSTSSTASNDDLYLNTEPRTGGDVTLSAAPILGKLKLYLINDGIYRIYYDSLSTTPDFPDELIEANTLQLVHRGEEQAIHVHDGGDGIFGDGDYFDFIGKQNYFSGSSQYFDPYSDINVYWLDWGIIDGLRFIEESGTLVDQSPVRPTSFWDVAHVEEDLLFDRLGQVDTDQPTITRDHYFWSSVNSGQREEVPFFLPDPARGSSENLQITVGLHGLTYSDNGGTSGHELFAFVNENSIGSGSWSQQEEYTLVSPSALNLSHNILSASGDNVLAIFAPVSTEPGNYDRIVLNWMEIGYEHLLTVRDDALRFRKSFINPNTDLEYEVSGFTNPDLVVYKEGLSKITGFTIRENWDNSQPQYSLVFQDLASDATPDYWTASTAGLLQPILTQMDTSRDLRHEDADLIIITTPEFIDDLDEYLLFKENEGWNPIAVSAVDIYDEFNYGITSPLAIKAFLQFAHRNWPSKPEYVLLMGDAISNPQQAKRDTRVRNIPTFYMQTYGWGAAEADYWYTLVDGDDYIPDLKIGRLPVNDLEDLERALGKLIRYGSGENHGSWQNELVTIAGFESTFKSQSEFLLQYQIPQDYMPSRVFIDRDSEGQIFWGDTDSLVALWNAGKLLINFLGHGGGAVWADRSLFTRSDVQYLQAETPPAFITSMTCFTASFAQVSGLGEEVLTGSPAGAIGWFGSSGVGWIINDYLLIQPLLNRLLTEDRPVGEVINLARMEYFLANSGYDYLKPSMLFQYNFLGDPTTRLQLPEKADLVTSASDIYSASDQISLSYSSSEVGTLSLLPIDPQNHPWWTKPLTYETDLIQNYLIDQSVGTSAGLGRTIYTLDRGPELSAMQGAVSYAIDASWFEHIPPTAQQLSGGGSIPISVQYHHASLVEADSMALTFFGGHAGSHTLIKEGLSWNLPSDVELSPSSGTIYYRFSAWNQGVLLGSSGNYILQLPTLISLSLSDITPTTNVNRCGISINYSLADAPDLTVRITGQIQFAGYSKVIDETELLLEGNHNLFIPSLFGPDPVDVSLSFSAVDHPELAEIQYSSQLSTDYRQIFPGLGITFDGVSPDTLRLWSWPSLVSVHPDTAWIRVLPSSSILSPGAGLTLYNDSLSYSIESSARDIQLTVVSQQSLFFKSNMLPIWERVRSAGTLYYLHGKGLLAMGVQQNFTPPDVSMMIEGQLFFDGDYMLADSRLNLLAEDPNGFTWQPDLAEIQVDGMSVELSLGDTTETGQIISIVAGLDLSVGSHTLTYKVSDALGNWSDLATLTGVVTGDAEIIDYGNYPNPFEGETLLIYELTQPLTDVVIDIYTISGYKLHSIDAFVARVGIPLGAIGYHEVPWNGRDRNDDFVANGVYFYRIRGKYGQEELTSQVGKMVKNR